MRGRIVVVIAVSGLLIAGPVSAGIEDQLRSVFNEMSNTTAPGISKTQKRGVIAGGGYRSGARIMKPNLVSFVPPSYQAGCGGIDLFGGSFSFINGDEIVQLFRAVAANAKGLLFELAMKQISKPLADSMSKFQKMIQTMNQQMKNSCQLAQGILKDTLPAKLANQVEGESLTAMITGTVDKFQQFAGNEPDTAQKATASSKGKPCQFEGNLMWCALKEKNVTGWFDSGDEDLLRTIMSLTGTVVIGKPVDDHAKEGKSRPIDIMESILTVKDFLVGGNTIPAWKCEDGYDAKKCLKLKTTTTSWKGMNNYVKDMLMGTTLTPGIINNIAGAPGSDTDVATEQFLANMPLGSGVIIRRLAARSAPAATAFAQKATPHIALAMTMDVIEALHKAARLASTEEKNAQHGKLMDVLRDSRNQVGKQETVINKENGSMTTLFTFYESMTRLMDEQSVLKRQKETESSVFGLSK